MSLFDLNLQQIHAKLQGKEITVADLVDQSYTRIGQVESKVRAFLTLDEENARQAAAKLDEQLASGQTRGDLFGLPIGIKDNMVTEGLRTTCASKFLSNYNPIYDATVVSKLKEAQTVTIGKLNMDEFAMGGSNENSAYHPTHNPWNTDYVPGAPAVVLLLP